MPLLIDNDTVSEVLDPLALVDAVESEYRHFSQGRGVSAPRQDLQAEPSGDLTYQLGVTAGVTEKYACLRIKSDMTFLRDVGGVPRKEKYAVEPGVYCGLILLFSVENGAPLAILHDGLLQQMRVGADSAIGARLMAKGNPQTLGILGSGGMAMSHLKTVAPATGIRQVLLYSPTEGHSEKFAKTARCIGFETETRNSAAEVSSEADILCACTSAIGPVIFGDNLRPGTHVVAIGGGLDESASNKVDRWLRLGMATAAPEWGGQNIEDECLSFSASGEKSKSGGTRRFHSIPPKRRLLLRDLLTNPAKGRTSQDQITFSDRGNIHGLQFAAAAGHIYERALAAGLGREMALTDFTQTVRN